MTAISYTPSYREYPKNEAEAQNYVDLLKELRAGLDALAQHKSQSSRYELTIAAVCHYVSKFCILLISLQPCGPTHFEKLKIKEMDRYLDFWNLMAYDYSGSWESTVNHQANVYSSSPNGISTERAVKFYHEHGVAKDKLVIGVPLYGRSFANTEGLGKPYSGVGQGSWEQGV